MNLIRYKTPTELGTWNSLDRLTPLRELLDSAFQLAGNGTPDRAWAPPVELHEDKDQYTVQLELPGMNKEDFEIALDDGVLSVSGERKLERETKDSEVFRTERFYGSFRRQVSIPAAVKTEEIKATYKDGVLHISLPKAEEAKPKKITVSLK